VSNSYQHPSLPFKVDEDGNVYSARGKLLPGTCNGAGYLRVSYRQGSRSTKTATLHRIVAETLIPNPDSKPVVNHIDGDKKNNHPSNLEWCTHSENQQHCWDTGLVTAYERTSKHREALAVVARTQPRGPEGWCIPA